MPEYRGEVIARNSKWLSLPMLPITCEANPEAALQRRTIDLSSLINLLKPRNGGADSLARKPQIHLPPY